MAYTKKIKFSSTNNYGSGPRFEDDVYTIEEFKELCAEHSFIDYDGYGYPVKDKMADTSMCITPSKIYMIPQDATHIVWYNR